MKIFQLIALVLLIVNYGYAQSNDPKAINDFSTLHPPKDQQRYEVTVTAETPYRIFINDVPLMSSAKAGTIKFPINSAIIASGDQQIRVQRQSSNTQGKGLEVTVQKSGSSNILWKSNLDNKKEDKGIFQATVPYELTGWKHGLVVDKDNQMLINQAKLWFEQAAADLRTGNGEAFMNLLNLAELHTFQANLLTKTEAQAYHNGWKNFINKGGIKLSDLKSAQVEIVGDGKLLHLINETGEGALAIIHGTRKTIFDIYLFFSKGTSKPEAIIFNLVEY